MPAEYNGWNYHNFKSFLALDIDSDQHPDIVVVESQMDFNGVTFIHRGLGNGDFTAPRLYTLPREGPQAILIDVTGDVLPDLIGWAPNDGIGIGRLSIRANLGGGQFDEPAAVSYVGQHPFPPAIGDLDGDGRRDVALGFTVDQGRFGVASRVAVLFNTARDAPTPVLVEFLRARLERGSAHLEWRALDGAVAGSVARSENGGPWRGLGEARSDGTGTIAFVDATVRTGFRYAYRFEYVRDGAMVRTPSAELSVPVATLSLAVVGPNPARGAIRLAYALPAAGAASVELFDVTGRRVLAQQIPADATATLDLAPMPRLASGLYWARLTQSGRSTSTRVVVLP